MYVYSLLIGKDEFTEENDSKFYKSKYWSHKHNKNDYDPFLQSRKLIYAIQYALSQIFLTKHTTIVVPVFLKIKLF